MGTVVNFFKGGKTALEAALKREQNLESIYQRKIAEQFHQFRTPLQAMLHSTRILADETYGRLGDSRYTDEAETVHRSVLHLLRISDAKKALSGAGGKRRRVKKKKSMSAI